ncbi:MAG: YiiD C-terminal domain-containing protein [Dokdonella sp.]
MNLPVVRNPAPSSTDACAALERELLADIPLARAMALSVSGYAAASLTLAAPLAPNVNDKGCAFGGSLASLMTLAGWGLLKLAVDARALDCDIYVQDSTVRYLAPVWQDFSAVARLDDAESFDEFFAALDARGKGRVRVRCAVPLPQGGDAATLEARFVALAKR